MAALSSIALGGAALLGGITGAQKDVTKSQVNVAGPNDLELQAGNMLGSGLSNLQQLINQGAGGQDIAAGVQGQRSLADFLSGSASLTPQQGDISAANQFAQQIFAPQQQAMQQQFDQQRLQTNQLAAQLGRPVNDPILQAKLAQQQSNQMGQLQAQQGQFAGQQALGFQQQRLRNLSTAGDIRQNIAAQALQNRLSLLQFGRQIRGQGMQFRAQTAQRETSSGGGFGGVVSGALASAGTGADVMKSFGE